MNSGRVRGGIGKSSKHAAVTQSTSSTNHLAKPTEIITRQRNAFGLKHVYRKLDNVKCHLI